MGGCLSRQAEAQVGERPPGTGPRKSPNSTNTRSSQSQSKNRRQDKGKGRGRAIEMSHLHGLRAYATLANPRKSLPPTTLLTANANTVVVFDAYPKAKYHFLVLPRYPFRRSGAAATQDSENEAANERSLVPLGQLDDLKSLLLGASSDARQQVIQALAETAAEVEEMIRDEMVKTEGFEWKIDVGFHAIPSMKSASFFFPSFLASFSLPSSFLSLSL